MANPVCTNTQGKQVEYINGQWTCNNSHSPQGLTPSFNTNALGCPVCNSLWSNNALQSQLTAPTPSAIPASLLPFQGYGRVIKAKGSNGNWLACACGKPSAMCHSFPHKSMWCDPDPKEGGCGAEWDYQTVQNAAIGTDLPATYPNAKGLSLSGQALTQTPAQLPILKPYARVQQGLGGNYLECPCAPARLPAWQMSRMWTCTVGCNLEWSDADVQAASVGDLLPGTPIGQTAPNKTNAPFTGHLYQTHPRLGAPLTQPIVLSPTNQGQAGSYSGVSGAWTGSSYGPPATPPMTFNPFDAPEFDSHPTPTTSGKKCVICRGDWCEALDQFFGDKTYAQWCQPCRKKQGVRG